MININPQITKNQASIIFDWIQEGNSEYFKLHLSALDDAFLVVEKLILERFPNKKIPNHSRVAHLSHKDFDYYSHLSEVFKNQKQCFSSKNKFELLLISCLLDAGSGSEWSFKDPTYSLNLSGSEGLAGGATELYKSMFLKEGAIKNEPFYLTARHIRSIQKEEFIKAFQHEKDSNPLLGIDTRYETFQNLANILEDKKEIFGDKAELCGLYHHLQSSATEQNISAKNVFCAVYESLESLFPSKFKIEDKYLCDSYYHPSLTSKDSSKLEAIPFFKLLQWTTYSICDFLQLHNYKVTELESLSGLAEYRNGGFFIDIGVISLKSKKLSSNSYHLEDKIIVEWRALTIHLLEKLLEKFRSKNEYQNMTMSQLLEGGTWQAGRNLAKKNRPNQPKSPPIQIITDGRFF